MEEEGPKEDIQEDSARQEPSRRKGWSSHGVYQQHWGFSSVVLASQVPEQREHTADVIHS